MKKIFCLIGIFSVCLCIWSVTALAQQTTSGDEANYVGTWASNYVRTTSTAGATFVHIERLAENRYIAISFSNEQRRFSFVGGGYVRDDGVLQITTDTGHTHLYTHKSVGGYAEALSLTDPNYVEFFGPYIRIAGKFTEWPFPETIDK